MREVKAGRTVTVDDEKEATVALSACRLARHFPRAATAASSD